MTAPSPRPTPEQVDAALTWARVAGIDARVLAAEVRALRVELDETDRALTASHERNAELAARADRPALYRHAQRLQPGRVVQVGDDRAAVERLLAEAPADYPGLSQLRRLRDERPAHAPAPRPAVRTGSFATPGGPRRFADEGEE